MDENESATESDDTLDDDCTCPADCDHEYRWVDDVWKAACVPACPVHGSGEPGVTPHLTKEQRRSQARKFTWYPDDGELVQPGEPDDDGDAEV